MTEHENTIPVWRYDVTETNFPCGCCSPTHAMEGGLWTCQRKTSSSSYKSWFVVDDEVDLSLPHDVRMCNGTCNIPFHHDLYQLAQCDMNGETWGDLLQTWDEERKALMTQEERTALIEQERAADAETNRLAPLIQLRKFIMQKAEQKALSSRYGCNKGRKENKPCPDLYTPDHHHPTTLGVSSECWAYEVTDPMTYEFINPKTKEYLPLAESYGIKEHIASKKTTIKQNRNAEWVLVHVVHVCWNQHPGDPGWKEQWMTDYRYKEPVAGGDGADGANWFQANTNPHRTQNRATRGNRGGQQNRNRR